MSSIYAKRLGATSSPPPSSGNGPTKNKVLTLRFQTISHEEFNFLGELFDARGKKHVPAGLIANNLTPRGMAYWFQDDGGRFDYRGNGGKGLVFHTQGFSLEDNQVICHELGEKFGLDC